MWTKREFKLRVLDIIQWVDYESGISCAPWTYYDPSEARWTLKRDIGEVERAESVQVHLIGNTLSKRVVIKVER